jgi:hypothetical protein
MGVAQPGVEAVPYVFQLTEEADGVYEVEAAQAHTGEIGAIDLEDLRWQKVEVAAVDLERWFPSSTPTSQVYSLPVAAAVASVVALPQPARLHR